MRTTCRQPADRVAFSIRLACGLVSKVVAPDALVETALIRARELDGQPAFRQIKRDQRRKALDEVTAALAGP